MNKYRKLLLIALALLSTNLLAERGFYVLSERVVVTKVIGAGNDKGFKSITFLNKNKQEVTKGFRMEILKDHYHTGTTDSFELADMPLNKEYYIRIMHTSKANYEKDLKGLKSKNGGSIFYIGTVEYPF
ncbi:hypothetical protein MNBD_GAMMA01-2323 [hydrothermal vent metagenome]|uniref:Uncharacterized protein n=1 Tax=hydrothermal vent metagenome TaxID=652676 RepID=A0A3B0VRI4_9ZZZZ